MIPRSSLMNQWADWGLFRFILTATGVLTMIVSVLDNTGAAILLWIVTINFSSNFSMILCDLEVVLFLLWRLRQPL